MVLSYSYKIDDNPLISIDESWEQYSDFLYPEFNYRLELKQLRTDDGKETLKENEERWAKFYRREKSLKAQHLGDIRSGYFEAFGIELTPNGSTPEKRIPADFFDPYTPHFEIDWEAKTITSHGTKFVGVKVRPSQQCIDEAKKGIDRMLGAKGASVKPIQVGSISPSPPLRGRPSHKAKILSAISHHAAVDPNWWETKTPVERRLAYFEYIKNEYGLDPKKTSGFNPRTIEKYETEFRKTQQKQGL